MPDPSQPEPLSFVRNIVFVFALYLYFAGWLHAYYFFLRFGISLNAVDIPAYYFFIYSYSVFGTGWGLLIFFLIIVFLVLGLKWEAKRAHIVLVIFILLFPAVFYAARAAGQKDASKKRSGSSNTVRFLFKKDTEDRLDAGVACLNKSEAL